MTMTTNLMRSPVVLYYARFNKTRAGKEMSFFLCGKRKKRNDGKSWLDTNIIQSEIAFHGGARALFGPFGASRY